MVNSLLHEWVAGTFVSPRPPICAQTTPHRYTTRHGTKTPGPEVGVKPNLAWQPERAVTTGTRADGPRPLRATQHAEMLSAARPHMTDDVQTDSRCPGLAEVVTTAPTTCSSWQWPSESKIRILRLKALDTYARNCTQQLARSYLATYRWTHDARASAHKP